ncbi:hypothetical protein KW782_04170 [Candidatus Parcubacteria bacterium]|nr:hypothetical protein [Candidatus Parcubacteria bacterium]
MSKRYKLRGAVIGFVLGIIPLLMLGALDWVSNYDLREHLNDVVNLFFYPDLIALSICQGLCREFAGLIYYISTPVSYTLWGILIGHIYGKIKNRNL